MTIGKWIKKWKTPKSDGQGDWIVSFSDKNIWGCSCPVWKFRRQECHHIKLVKMGGGTECNETPKPKPEYLLARVHKPVYQKKENQLLVPLIGIPDAHLMEATIIYNMMKYGYSFGECKEIRGHIPHSWTAKAIFHHIESHGEAEYPEGWYDH